MMAKEKRRYFSLRRRDKAFGLPSESLSYIVLADWRMDENLNWHLHGAKMVRIDGKQYKADTWYRMEEGKIVEVSV